MSSIFPGRRLDIAVIGTGIAGLSAAWLLSRRHRVTVYEKNPWIGGHSNTVDAVVGGKSTPVDTGFIVYNERNYPNLTALFDHLSVPTRPSDMSFAASLEGGRLEYCGSGFNSLFGQRRNLLRPRFWRMVADLLRFYREAPEQIGRPGAVTLGEYLVREGYGRHFIEDHLLPMGAAIWSTTEAQMMDYPATAFLRFFASHGLLGLGGRPQWRTITGGSREYVRRLTAPLEGAPHGPGVRAVRRDANGVDVLDRNGVLRRHDHAVLATHADQAHRLLADPDPFEDGLIGGWTYTPNRVVLHTDPNLMPRRRRVWASWNFIGAPGDGDGKLCVTYWMNQLQSLRLDRPLLLTLNPVREPAPGTRLGEFDYSHPCFDPAALDRQDRLWSLQGHRRTWYCGSYFGYGFHEDALQSGLAVAEELGGVTRPWSLSDADGRIRRRPSAPARAA